MADFRSGCSVTPNLEPSCSPIRPAIYDRIIYDRIIYDPAIAPRTALGSSKFRGKEELIDEIYVSAPFFDKLKTSRTYLDYGLVGDFFKGSDHKLVWIDLPL